MPQIADSVFDAGLATITAGGTKIDICETSEPANFAGIAALTLGNKAGLTTGAATDNTPTGRKVVVPAITDGAVTKDGTAAYWALSNGTDTLYASGPMTGGGQAVTNGNTFTLDAIDIAILDATAV